jgi:endonuclease/exonuclease/phosphatase (EEP) superfamily protein YafD
MRIPIDHVLHTPDIRVYERKNGPRVGSDHLPVMVEFYLPSRGE